MKAAFSFARIRLFESSFRYTRTLNVTDKYLHVCQTESELDLWLYCPSEVSVFMYVRCVDAFKTQTNLKLRVLRTTVVSIESEISVVGTNRLKDSGDRGDACTFLRAQKCVRVQESTQRLANAIELDA
jgi:hypothetical protein